MSGFEIPLIMAAMGMQALGSIQQGNAQAAAGQFNADIAERNAGIATQQGAEEERRQRLASRKTLGSMRAAIGSSGVTREGSAMDVLEESAYASEMDAQTIKYNTKLKTMGYQSDAQLDRMNAKNAKTAGYMGAGSAMLLGGADAYKKFASQGSSTYSQSHGWIDWD